MAKQQPHPIEAMCLAHQMCLYWSAREAGWCHMDGWPCPASPRALLWQEAAR